MQLLPYSSTLHYAGNDFVVVCPCPETFRFSARIQCRLDVTRYLVQDAEKRRADDEAAAKVRVGDKHRDSVVVAD